MKVIIKDKRRRRTTRKNNTSERLWYDVRIYLFISSLYTCWERKTRCTTGDNLRSRWCWSMQ